MKKKLLMMSLVLMSAFSANAANMVGPCVQSLKGASVQNILLDVDSIGWSTELYTNENGSNVYKFGTYSSNSADAKNALLRCKMQRQSLINQGYQPYPEQLEVNAD